MFLESPPVAHMNATQQTPERPSLIETMRSTAQGEIPLLALHLQRLRLSAQHLQYPCPLSQIEKTLRGIAHQPPPREHRLRLLLHADGRFESGRQPVPPLPDQPMVVLAQPRLHRTDLWLQHKTTYRPLYEDAHAWLQTHPGYFDCIFLNQYGQLCEGSRSNVYLQLDGHWYTPPLQCGLLPGIMRHSLLAAGQVRERILGKAEMIHAQAWRISNAVHGWLDASLDESQCAL